MRTELAWLGELLWGVTDEPDAEARFMLAHVRKMRMGGAALLGPLSDRERGELINLVEGRKKGVPLQYLLGEWDFMGLTLKVDARALIPRQDTETLAEFALCQIKRRGYRTALDLCTGSGCVAIALAKLGGPVAVTAVDVSCECIALASENAALHGVQVEFLRGDLFGPVAGKRFDIITCNPPYIPENELASLQKEISFEPRLALCGGKDGLDFYRALTAAQGYLNPGGLLAIECGCGQAGEVSRLFSEAGFSRVGREKDVPGIERVVYAYN